MVTFNESFSSSLNTIKFTCCRNKADFQNTWIWRFWFVFQQVQHLQNGLILRKAYVENLNLLKDTPQGLTKKVFAISTVTPRTTQSVIAFLYGLIPQFHLDKVFCKFESLEYSIYCSNVLFTFFFLLIFFRLKSTILTVTYFEEKVVQLQKEWRAVLTSFEIISTKQDNAPIQPFVNCQICLNWVIILVSSGNFN